MAHTPSTHSTPKQVFLHLLLIGVFYMSVISGIQLIFAYIDLLFIDPLKYTDYWSLISNYDNIRWASSVLLVCVPIYIGLNRFMYKEMREENELQHLWIRRWLLSLTLFIAAITMIGSLVSVIYNFYGGDLTTTFALKVLFLLLISAAIFAYYRWDMKRDMAVRTTLPRIAAYVVAGFVLISIISGFFIAGSPMEQRKVRFDQQRVSDLQQIQSQIVTYYTQKSILPSALPDLNNELYGFMAPVDPETDAQYEYTKTSDLTFTLCATFGTDGTYTAGKNTPITYYDSVSAGYLQYPDQWKHAAERTCFTRTIDPDYFKTTPSTPVK